MSQEVLVTLTDDLDGATYEIDLNAKNADALRKTLDKYVAAARTAKPSTVPRRSRTNQPAASPPPRRRPEGRPRPARTRDRR